ncbi:MAG: hypothetical protein FJ096_04330 [Deltaproteobacteria bacterium]|nr:hypothetical protein [Deltaproteobacteria bacterium]
MLPLSATVSLVALALIACCHPSGEPKAGADVGATATASGAVSSSEAPSVATPGTAAHPTEAAGGQRGAPLVGGYHPREVTEAEIVEVSKKAVELVGAKEGDASLVLVAIDTAASQVVAGMNFALGLKVKGKVGHRSLTVVLYRDLKNTFTLTSIAVR